jgi:hypothetical protein
MSACALGFWGAVVQCTGPRSGLSNRQRLQLRDSALAAVLALGGRRPAQDAQADARVVFISLVRQMRANGVSNRDMVTWFNEDAEGAPCERARH